MTHVVVIGAGQAAASLVARLRGDGFDGQITLIGAEPVPPYQRPPLSKAYMLGDLPQDRLMIRPAEWYAEAGITLRSGLRATGLRPDLRQVELEGREMLDYDHLVLATGAHPRQLPAEMGGALNGVHYMRDLADADALAPQIAEGRRLLVIGGGYIGLEAAAVAAQKGMKVTLIEAAERILQRVACPQTSDYFRALHQQHGVEIREGVGLERLTGDDHVSGAVLSDGSTLEADLALVGIGVLPATVLAEAAGLEVENGIVVDAFGRSSDPQIWAIGDCASLPQGSGRMRLESVGNAIDMGDLVARNILGAEARYDMRPWFWSDQYDVKLQIAGLGTGHDRVVVRGGNGLSHWYYQGDRLIAVDAMNDPRAYMAGKRMIETGISPDPEALADPQSDLKALMRP